MRGPDMARLPDVELIPAPAYSGRTGGDLQPALAAAKQFLQSRRLRGEWLVRVTVGCDHRLEEIWSPDESRQGGAG